MHNAMARRNGYAPKMRGGWPPGRAAATMACLRRNRYGTHLGEFVTYTVSVSASFFCSTHVQWKLGGNSVDAAAEVYAETGTLRPRKSGGRHAETGTLRRAQDSQGGTQKWVRRRNRYAAPARRSLFRPAQKQVRFQASGRRIGYAWRAKRPAADRQVNLFLRG